MSRSRAADDFATIRARVEELRRERDGAGQPEGEKLRRRANDLERRRRIEGWPPRWGPTIVVRKPRR